MAMCHTIAMPVIELTSRLSIRLPRSIKERIEQAATISGLSVTDFTISNLIESAEQVLERHHSRTLSRRDRDIFLAMIDADTEPSDRLVAAAKAREDLIAE